MTSRQAIQGINNIFIAKLLRKIAVAYTILGENRFKVIAYENAATAVEHATSELKDLWDEGKLDSLSGIGSSISAHLDDMFSNGSSRHFEEVLKKVNAAVFPLLDVPGIGPKKAIKLINKLKLTNEKTVIEDIKEAAKNHLIAQIEDFGAKSEADILEGIERFKKGSIKEKRMNLPLASMLSEELINYLKEHLGSKIIQIDTLGSMRRQLATIGDLDLAVATEFPQAVIDAFINFPKKVSLIEQGPTGASILLASGRQADLRVAKPQSYGAMLQYFTGSKYHNIKFRELALKNGFSLNEYGVTKMHSDKKQLVEFPTEELLYNFFHMDYIPPEMREDQGELDLAIKHQIPKLIELQDVKGDLQVHSNFDLETSHDSGDNSIEEIQSMANNLGYEFVAITNHNPSSSKHNRNQIFDKLKRQKNKIDQLNYSTKSVRIISMLEVDILTDGNLPVHNEALDLLDGVLVSIHSQFSLSKNVMTERVLKGLSHPKARIFAHPTGRLLDQREGYELDWEKIFTFCLENNKALEINASVQRLDLPDVLVREAVKRNVFLTLGTDAHRVEDMSLMRFGVSVARRGWVTKKHLVNCWSYKDVIQWLHQKS